MRVLVTGATGFVGRWLIRELQAAGHRPIPTPGRLQLDITDERGVTRFVSAARADAIAHLAGVSHAGEASRDPAHAFAVNEGGTRAVIRAVVSHGRLIPVLVTGSGEVYGRPEPADLPLREEAPLHAKHVYALSKLAQEQAALELGSLNDVPVIVTRSFNHTGPGQGRDFVAPALAYRVLEAKRLGRPDVAVGNLEVRRDIGDVRDVVRAYRLLLEGLASGGVPSGAVVNVATGSAVTIRWVLEALARTAGIAVRPMIDPSLVREDDPPVMVGDPGRLRAFTGWAPVIPLEQTLADLFEGLEHGQAGGFSPSIRAVPSD